MRRGDALLPMTTDIVIDLAEDLSTERITVTQTAGPEVTRGFAEREPHSRRWRVQYSGEPVRTLPDDTVPIELVPLLIARRPLPDRAGAEVWRGRVVMAGHGFAVGRMRVVAGEPRQLEVTLRPESVAVPPETAVAAPLMRGRWRLTRYGRLARADGDDGVSAIRAHPGELALPFEPPEVVRSASIPVHGQLALGSDPSFTLAPLARRRPPSLPGQQVRATDTGWHVRLSAGDHPALPAGASFQRRTPPEADRARVTAEFTRLAADAVHRARAHDARSRIAALVRATDRLLTDDLAAPVTGARSALTLGRGDCTAHALLFVALAEALGIETRLVTGYRLDGALLVRHRWALAAVDGAWMAVDPTHGEAPARARLLGLAVHGTTSAELATVDQTVFNEFARVVAHADEPEVP